MESMGAEWAILKNYEEREKYVHNRRAFVAECEAVGAFIPYLHKLGSHFALVL